MTTTELVSNLQDLPIGAEHDYLEELQEVEEAEREAVDLTTDYSKAGVSIYELVGYKFNSSI